MIIVQLSDLHLRADGRYPRHDAGAALSLAVSVINRMRPRSDAVLFTGDLLDRSTRDYTPVRLMLRALSVPLLAVPGNHDDPAAFRRAFGNDLAYAPEHLSFVHACADGRVIGLDSNGPGGSAMLDSGRLAWLEDRLREDDRPTLIGMHHPPFTTGMPRYDDAPFPGADALMRLLAAYAERVRLVAGHTHRALTGFIGGVQVGIGPPLGHALALGLVPDAPHAHTPEAPAMHIHLIDQRQSITHSLALAPDQPVEAMTGMLDAAGRSRLIAP
ncbi:MAG: metallophosphoesterase [Salinarimonas sp.]|nr:metallophosphoesterase [Salinarimonas sp.]